MDRSDRVDNTSTACQKENSPPCAVDVQELPGVTRLKTTADVFSINKGNQGPAAALKSFQDSTRKTDIIMAPQSQQPLQPRNSIIPMNKQNEKVQPELLRKFRQLRQWQQQQQESMFKQQQEQMATLKMQQNQLQSLYQKAVSTSGSPLNDVTANKTHEQKLNTSMESFFKSLKTQEKVEALLANPISYSGNQDRFRRQGSPTSSTTKTSPVLMTPMQFMSPESQSKSLVRSPENFRWIGPTHSLVQENNSLSSDTGLPRKIIYKQEDNEYRDCEVISLDDQSNLESQPDYQSDADTMSGVYPLQDDMSEACSVEMENGQRNLEVEEEEESDEEQQSDLENTVHERLDPKPTKALTDDEDRPINPGIGATKASTFEELLEKELSNELNKQAAQNSPSPVKPQRKFLRKGQGLARFNMKPTAPKKQNIANQKSFTSIRPSQQVAKTQRADRNSIPTKQETTAYSKQLLSVPQSKVNNVELLKICPFKSQSPRPQNLFLQQVQRKIAGRTAQSTSSNDLPKSSPQQYGFSVLASRVIGPYTSMPHGISTIKTTGAVTKTTLTSLRRDVSPRHLSPLTSLDLSFQKQGKEWEELKEEEDLEEFEMLEQAAADASFSSNSSLVVKVLERARSQKPGIDTASGRKTDVAATSRDSQVPSILSPVDTGYGSGEGRSTGSVIVGSQAGSVSSVEDANTTDNESTEGDDENDTTLREMDSDDDAESLPPSSQIPSTNQPQRGSSIPGNSDNLLQSLHPVVISQVVLSQDDFDDQEAWGEIKAQTNSNESESDEDSDADVTISDVFPLRTIVPQPRDELNTSERQKTSSPGIEIDIISTPPTSALVSKLFPKLKPKPKVEENQVNNATVAPVVSASGPSKEVQEKLKQLEEEINKFRAENKALVKIRNERDEGLKRLQKEIDSFEKQKTEELDRLEKFREEEMQKLRRERRTFEKYQKAARNNPDKKEREEIEALRSQIAELQEEMKRRESRWSAANSRYRNRIEALEEQNKELQEEVKLLEKYRLEKWRNDELKAKDSEEAKPRDIVLRKTVKPEEPAINEAFLNNEVMHSKKEAIRQSPPQPSSPLKQRETVKLDFNNNKTKLVDQPPVRCQGNPVVAKGVTERVRATSEDEIKTQEKQEEKSTSVHSVIPGMSKLSLQEIEHPDGKVEHVKPDGSRVIMFANGTRKEISTDGQTVIVSFFNGDIKQLFPDQRVVYYYSDAKTTHTTYPDGLEVLQFPNNQVEKHYVDGTKEIIFPDQTIKYLYVDGTEECVFADGTIQRMRGGDGERIIEFPNGQREVHTKHYKRREYPDGTIKTVYPDGRTETRYSTGRLRVKDRDGRVLVDTVDRLLQQNE